MNDYEKITKQIGISFIFYILTFIFSPITVLILTRTLTVSEYGVYSILSATITVFASLLLLGLPTFLLTKLSEFESSEKIKVLFSIGVFEILFISIVIITLFIPPIQKILLSYLKLESYKFEFQLSLIIVFLSVLFNLVSHYLKSERKIEFQSFVFFLYRCFWMILLILSFIFFREIKLSLIFILFGIGVVVPLILSLLYLKKEIFFFFTEIKKISLKIVKKSLSFSLPLMAVTTSYLIITLSDRYMINYFGDAAQTGIYALSYSLVTMVSAFSGIATAVLYPYIAKSWNNKSDNHQILFNASLKYSLIIILPSSVGLIILRDQIITLISGSAYLLGSFALLILAPFPLFVSLIGIYTNNLLLKDKTKLIAFGHGSGAILNIILNIILIPRYGINGAAASTLLSYIFMGTIFYLLTRKQITWNYNFLRIKRISIAALLMGIVIYYINPQIYLSKILTIIFGIIVYVMLLFLFGSFIKKEYLIMRKILHK